MRRESPQYGLDAPGVVRGVIITAVVLIVLGLFFTHRAAVSHTDWQGVVGVSAFNTGLWCLASGLLMLLSSYVGKFKQRDVILARLHLRGDETVLDVGCGHGLLLIGAAKLLARGRAVGIDLWSQVDQSDNSREATLRNAKLEGVADRVDVRDGDMRSLPFPDASFDAAVAHFAIHNISTHEGRREAIREIVRVLKPGGQVALSDLKTVGLYADELRKRGMTDVKISAPALWTWPPSRTVTAHKRGDQAGT